MATRLCFRCDVKAHMTLVDSSIQTRADRVPDGAEWWFVAAYTCDECGTMSIGETRYGESQPNLQSTRSFVASRKVDRWIPAQASGRNFPDVPQHIAGAATEAYECHSIGAFRGACAIARAVIEATAKERGITTGRIFDKIEQMTSDGLIRPHIGEAAHEVRHLGNETAHGDFVEPVAREEATLALELMSEVLDEVYASIARIERAKAARQRRRQATA